MGSPITLDRTRARIHFYINFGLFVSYTLFVICRTAQIFSDPTASLVDKIHLTFMSALCIIIANVYMAVVRTRSTFVPFLRRYIRFLQNVEKSGQPCTRAEFTNCAHFLTLGGINDPPQPFDHTAPPPVLTRTPLQQ